MDDIDEVRYASSWPVSSDHATALGPSRTDSVGNDASLTPFDMSSLTTVGADLGIWDNAFLCQAHAEAFAASIDVGGSVTVENNGSARTDCD